MNENDGNPQVQNIVLQNPAMPKIETRFSGKEDEKREKYTLLYDSFKKTVENCIQGQGDEVLNFWGPMKEFHA